MNTTKVILGLLLVFALFVFGFWYTSNEVNAPTSITPFATPTPSTTIPLQSQRPTYKDLVQLTNLRINEDIESPLTLTGEARGTWYFEASFPVILTNWDGLIIAEGVAQAQSDWMTEEYVPFEVTLTFEPPYKAGDPEFMQRGALILKKDNPSGLPENDDAFEFPVQFAPVQ